MVICGVAKVRVIAGLVRACPGDDGREAQRFINRDGRDKPGHDQLGTAGEAFAYPVMTKETGRKR
jgi:hypothetical protein